MLRVLCEKRSDRLNLRGSDMEQSHLLSPLLVIDAFCLFINFERWKVMSALTAFQHFTVHWLKRYHYFRAGNQQICNVCFFALSLRGWNESCVGSSVWPGTASHRAAGLCMELCVRLCWCAGGWIRQESLRGGSKTAAGQVLQLRWWLFSFSAHLASVHARP